MDDPNTTTGTLEADEEILTPTMSDDALEAAAGSLRGITPNLSRSAMPPALPPIPPMPLVLT
jgi:hypothetical protein